MVFVTRAEEDFTSVPAHQLDILQRLRVSVTRAGALPDNAPVDLVIDGLIGYSLRGAPHGTAAALIHWANKQNAPVLSLDVPSGVDSTSGAVFEPAIVAEATMTLALPKVGLCTPGVAVQIGELYLCDISVPPELYAELSPGL